MSAAEAPRYALLVRIETTESVFRLWAGVGDYRTAAGDELDAEGATFTGIGIVGDIPALRQLIGGVAERITLSLDGLTDALLSLADDDASTVKGAIVNIGIVFFDGDWQDVAPVAWKYESAHESSSRIGGIPSACSAAAHRSNSMVPAARAAG